MNMMRRLFGFKHLPPDLQAVSRPFAELAEKLDDLLPSGEEKDMAFRKLLEAKDCAVRAVVFKYEEHPCTSVS